MIACYSCAGVGRKSLVVSDHPVTKASTGEGDTWARFFALVVVVVGSADIVVTGEVTIVATGTLEKLAESVRATSEASHAAVEVADTVYL
jgi:hypothetical protein